MRFGPSIPAAAGFILLLTAGCGKSTYEERLARTADYFAHIGRLNENLVARADRHGSASIRVPKQFSPLTDDEATEYNETQPYYLGVELPGMVAAYEAAISVDAEGQTEFFPAFIYVMTNEDRLLARATGGDGEDPLTLIEEVEYMLQGAFQVALPSGDSGDGSAPNVRYPEMIPARPVYEPSKRYTAVRFQYLGEEPVVDFGTPMEYTMYTVTGAGDLQVAIFIVAPEQPLPSEQLRQRVVMMLQTLQLDAPRASGSSPSTTTF